MVRGWETSPATKSLDGHLGQNLSSDRGCLGVRRGAHSWKHLSPASGPPTGVACGKLLDPLNAPPEDRGRHKDEMRQCASPVGRSRSASLDFSAAFDTMDLPPPGSVFPAWPVSPRSPPTLAAPQRLLCRQDGQALLEALWPGRTACSCSSSQAARVGRSSSQFLSCGCVFPLACPLRSASGTCCLFSSALMFLPSSSSLGWIPNQCLMKVY